MVFKYSIIALIASFPALLAQIDPNLVAQLKLAPTEPDRIALLTDEQVCRLAQEGISLVEIFMFVVRLQFS
jgi:hypothetical protein